MGMFLGREDVAELTGRKYRRLQIEQLRKMGIPFHVNAIGWPMVARAFIEGKSMPAPEPERPKWQPNLAAIEAQWAEEAKQKKRKKQGA